MASLSVKNIDGDGAKAKAIAEALKVNTTLTYLNLRFNYIGDECAKAIADALKDPNCKLTQIDLSGNNRYPS